MIRIVDTIRSTVNVCFIFFKFIDFDTTRLGWTTAPRFKFITLEEVLEPIFSQKPQWEMIGNTSVAMHSQGCQGVCAIFAQEELPPCLCGVGSRIRCCPCWVVAHSIWVRNCTAPVKIWSFPDLRPRSCQMHWPSSANRWRNTWTAFGVSWDIIKTRCWRARCSMPSDWVGSKFGEDRRSKRQPHHPRVASAVPRGAGCGRRRSLVFGDGELPWPCARGIKMNIIINSRIIKIQSSSFKKTWGDFTIAA